MVLVQDVLRYLMKPLEIRFRTWESATGFKGKLGRWLRIGKAPPGVFESWAKVFNNYYMMLYMMTQRPWGPLYKRIFEFDMHPGKTTFVFARHRWILFFWLGHNFVDDLNHASMMAKNSDYLLYYQSKYGRIFPRNSLNWRTSAHYLEIAHIYTVEMTKKLIKLENEMWDEHQREKELAQ